MTRLYNIVDRSVGCVKSRVSPSSKVHLPHSTAVPGPYPPPRLSVFDKYIFIPSDNDSPINAFEHA